MVESVVVVGEGSGSGRGRGRSSNIEEENQQAIARFIDRQGCRQVELSRFMDGVGEDYGEMGSVLYDWYKGGEKGIRAGEAAVGKAAAGEEAAGEEAAGKEVESKGKGEEEEASLGWLGRWQMVESRKVAAL